MSKSYLRKKRHVVKKQLLTESVNELKKKKICLENDIKELNKTLDDYSEQAEKKSDITLISKANALERHAKEKMGELKIC
ncbi:hypothetical protein JTE90_018161 [Oedothorax gibbosus]|uniref:Uncharacterized protein n=1 Tax=Oedothorax gibbosus TaxID=931172 RepID=A0AAV6UBC5_9ARAC|nr:hypothetical protein JTE90_018161 [Oedothorax gibbosus]